MNISDIDWKSLLLLEALISEGNVSRVASRFTMSQPAVSNCLARLRALFQDPLLIRTRQGMVPTERAKLLLGPIRQARLALEQTLTQSIGFDPSTSNRRFTVAATDYAEWIVAPKLVRLLAEAAPGIQLEVRPLVERIPLRDLEAGEIDIAIGHFGNVQATLYRQSLFEEDFVCLTSHRRGKKELTLKEYAGLKHLIVAPWGGMAGTVDALLAKKGLTRSIHASTPHFLLAPWMVAEAGYAVTIPRRVAETFARLLSLQVLELPFPLASMPFHQLWHERTSADAGCQWLRTKIREISSVKGG